MANKQSSGFLGSSSGTSNLTPSGIASSVANAAQHYFGSTPTQTVGNLKNVAVGGMSTLASNQAATPQPFIGPVQNQSVLPGGAPSNNKVVQGSNVVKAGINQTVDQINKAKNNQVSTAGAPIKVGSDGVQYFADGSSYNPTTGKVDNGSNYTPKATDTTGTPTDYQTFFNDKKSQGVDPALIAQEWARQQQVGYGNSGNSQEQNNGTGNNFNVSAPSNNQGSANNNNQSDTNTNPNSPSYGYVDGGNGQLLPGYSMGTNGVPYYSGSNSTFNSAYDQYKSASNLTADQQTQIQKAGQQAGAGYDLSISQAKQQAEQGMAKQVVGAGEAGGFMNSQMAGMAALTPTKGGTFVGAGGQLEYAQSQYQAQIGALENQKAAAIQQAESSMQDYLTTGNQKALEYAQKAMDTANQLDIQKQAASDTHKSSMQTLANNQLTYQGNVASLLAPSLMQQMTGDMTKDQALLQQAADANGVSPAMLSSAMISYKSDKEKQDLLNSAQYANILKGTVKGGVVNLPNGQQATILGDGGKTVSYGGKVYRDINGTLTDTGIKDSQLTPSDIMSFFSKSGDNIGADNYLRSMGVSVSNVGGVVIPQMIQANGQPQPAARNNNPGNLRNADGSWQQFATPEEGYQAMLEDVKLKMTGGSTHAIPDGPHAGQKLDSNSTLEDMIRVYAPSKDHNDPVGYAKTIADSIGADATKDTLGNLLPRINDITAAMAFHESGTKVTPKEDDIKTIADAIINGNQAPDLSRLYGKSSAVRAELERKGFDLKDAQLNYVTAQTWAKNIASPQAVRYIKLSESVVNSINEANRLSQEMDLGGVPVANYAQLQKYVQTEGNSPKGQKAAQYLAAVNTVKEEFANLVAGGYAPTEAAWKLANQQINELYGKGALKSSLEEVQKLINYRTTAILDKTNPFSSGNSAGQQITYNGVTYNVDENGDMSPVQ